MRAVDEMPSAHTGMSRVRDEPSAKRTSTRCSSCSKSTTSESKRQRPSPKAPMRPRYTVVHDEKR